MARRFVVYMMLLLGCYLLGQGSAASSDSSAQPLKYPAGDIHALTAFDLSIQELPPNAAGSPRPETFLGLRAACDEFQDMILLETSRTKLPCVRNGKTGEMPGWYASSVLASLRFSRAPPVI